MGTTRKKKTPRKVTTLRIPPLLMNWLRARAAEEHRSLNYLVEEALREKLDRASA